ncbi:MAG: hypothetical protein PHW63_08370 [Alphaproteobacteria bacterium]|nr:hypothetical protein [Alphaproteobacteria bacterium]
MAACCGRVAVFYTKYPLRHREDPALDAGDVAIQSPIFRQQDWITTSRYRAPRDDVLPRSLRSLAMT